MIEILKRVMDGLGLSEAEAQIYLDTLQLSVQVADLVPGQERVGVIRGALGTEFQAAVAAEYAMIQLANPADSGLLVYLDEACASATANVSAQLRTCPLATWTGATLSADRAWNDTRTPGAPGAQVRSGTNAALQGLSVWAQRIIANDNVVISGLETILRPGQSILLACNTVNTAWTGSFRWRERDWNPSA